MAHGGVKIEVNLDTSKLQGSLKGLEGEMVKSMAIFEVMKQTLTKVFGMITDSIDQAMRRIDTMDQFSRVMTTMTGSTDKANAALERTNAIVQGTAFGLDTAAKGVQAFVASGMEVTKATDTMGAWADAVAFYTKGTNAELETVSAALQKMQTKGNVTMEHMQMLLEAGIPAIQIYASAVGKSTEEVTDQMSKGELKTEDFIVAMNGAFKTGVAGFPAIAGAAKQAGASWQGSMDNMNAAIARGMASMLTEFDKMFDVKANIVNFGKTFEKVLKVLAENLTFIVPTVIALTGAIITLKVASSVASGIKTLSAMIEAATVNIVAMATGSNAATTAYIAQSVAQKALTAIMALGNVVVTAAKTLAIVMTGATWAEAAATTGLGAAWTALNVIISASPLGWILLAIVAVTAAIAGIVNAVKNANKEYYAEKDALKDLKEEHEGYADALRDSKDAAAQDGQEKVAQAQHNRALLDSLAALTDENGNYSGSADEAKAKIAELNSGVEGLGLAFDDATGKVSMSGDQLTEYGENLENIARWEASKGEYNNILSEQISLQAKRNALDDKIALYNQQEKDGILTAYQANKLRKEATKLADEYDESLLSLEDDVTSLDAAQKTEAQNALNGYKDRINATNEHGRISDQMTDEEIANIRMLINAGATLTREELARFEKIEKARRKEIVEDGDYVDAIKDGRVQISEAEAKRVAEARANGEELTEIEQATYDKWIDIQTEAIANGEQIWTDAEKAEIERKIAANEALTEVEQAYLDKWNDANQEANDKYKEQQQELVDAATDTKDKILLSEQQTAAERLEIQEHNLQVQRDFVDNYNSIMGKIPEEQQKYLAEMTMDDAAFLDSMISTWDDGGKEQWEKYVGNLETGIATAGEILPPAMEQMAGNVVDSAVNTVDAKSGEVQASGSGIGEDIGEGLSSSDAPNAAAQAVADGVVSNLSNADYSAITEAMANAIKSGTNAVQSAAQSMATAVAKVLQNLSTDARTEMTKTMTLMASAINTGRATLTNAMTAAMTAVKTAATTVANTFNTIGELIITKTKAGIDGHASAMSSSITAVMNAAKSAANAANTGWENIGYNMVAGMASGVRNNESILTSAIRSVVNAAIQAAKTAAVIKSPSRAFRDQVGRMIPLGIAEGVDDETLAAVKSVKNMTNQLIGASSASLTAKIAMANAGVNGSAGGGSPTFIQHNNITRPPETPGQVYRALQRTGRQMIKQFGR